MSVTFKQGKPILPKAELARAVFLNEREQKREALKKRKYVKNYHKFGISALKNPQYRRYSM